MLRYLTELNVPAHEVIRQKEGNILQQIPFNSKRKRACTILRNPANPDKVLVFSKGAPEIVIDYCQWAFDEDGSVVELTPTLKAKILKDIVTDRFAKKAYRTLLIAYRELSKAEYEREADSHNQFAKEDDREVLEKNLTVIGVFALQDPLREEIVESVKKCHRAGINIRMVTGDNLDTAKAIAVEAGIVRAEDADKEYVCMEGKQFRELLGEFKKMDDGKNRGYLKEQISNKKLFRDIASKLKVLARSTPEDKYMLVTGLKD